MKEKIAILLQKLSDECDKEGLQLVAVILDATPGDENTVTPINAWHPSWVSEFRKNCQNCKMTATRMVIQLGEYISEISDGTDDLHWRKN